MTTWPVGRIERRRRLVEQQHRMVGDEAARDVDALLLAAGKGRRRQCHSRSGRLSRASIRRPVAGGVKLRTAAHQRLGATIERGNARHGAQELADIADRVAPDFEHRARVGACNDRHRAMMAHQDLAARTP
jgi:hypothetical protein